MRCSMFEIMFPQLTTGAINRFQNGEDVTNAVMQLLGCRKIPGYGGDDRYRLLISDGVTGYSYAMLEKGLNCMVINKELENFAIFRVDKYFCTKLSADYNVINMQKLTILVPGNEVNEILGNPTNTSDFNVSTEAATNNSAENDAKTEGSKINAASSHDSSIINGSAQSITFPQLTTGAVNRILNGEDVTNPVMQILGCKKIPGAGNDRYRLLISDGVTAYSFAMLGTELNCMVIDKQLEKFTIFRLDKYVCNKVPPDRKVIILLKLTILASGNEVNEALGNPDNLSDCDTSTGAATNISTETDVAKTGYTNQNAASADDSSLINGSVQSMMLMMFPELTKGAINRILNGEDVPNPVMQILGYQKIIPESGNDRYRFLISDGVTDCPYAILGKQLNHLVENKELEEFTIVEVKKYVCNQIADRKVIILLRLSVVIPGSEVNEKLENPVTPSTEPATNATAENGVNKIGFSNQNAASAPDSSVIQAAKLKYEKERSKRIYWQEEARKWKCHIDRLKRDVGEVALQEPAVDQQSTNGGAESPLVAAEGPVADVTMPDVNGQQLTTGAINRILDGEDVSNPFMKIINCKKIHGSGDDSYRLLIFDGLTAWPFAKLGTELNHLVANKKLEKGPIVRVDKCVCNQVPGLPKEIILMSLTVLPPGNEFNEKLGNPGNSSNVGASIESATSASA